MEWSTRAPRGRHVRLWPGVSRISGREVGAHCKAKETKIKESECHHGTPSHCGHFMRKSRVSHRTAPEGPLTCLHVRTSKIFFIHASFCSVCHLPIQAPSVQVWAAMKERSSSTLRPHAHQNKESEVDPFLPAAAATCLLNFIILPDFVHDKPWTSNVLGLSSHVIVEPAEHFVFRCRGSGLGFLHIFLHFFQKCTSLILFFAFFAQLSEKFAEAVPLFIFLSLVVGRQLG